EDFHGDGSDGEVEIVLVDRLSWNKVKASLGEQIINDKLPMTTGVNVTLPCLSAPQQFGMVGLSSPYSLMGGSTKRAPVFGSAVSHTSEHSLASVPDVNTARLQNPHNWVAGNADELANFDWANTTGVELDDVVDLVFGEADFCGHVYNLENEQNWYLANGIIAHNCRSTT
ncbi:hypothetical protein IF169_24085, partial [Salmonella enterica subsp. enterica serovar Typhimurium]